MIKNINLEQEVIINELEIILDKEDYKTEYLEKYKKAYNISKENYSKVCEKCEEWKRLNLPIDCLCKPNYCVKYETDFWIIKLYDDLKMYIEMEL